MRSRLEHDDHNQAEDDKHKKENAFPPPSVFLVAVIGISAREEWKSEKKSRTASRCLAP